MLITCQYPSRIKMQLLRLQQHCGGAVLVEFAFLLPIFLLMIFGTYEVHRYVSVNHKLESTAFQLVDVLTNQRESAPPATPADVETALTNFIASANIMVTPYSSEGLKVIITSVTRDDATLGPGGMHRWQYAVGNSFNGDPESRVFNHSTGAVNLPLPLQNGDQVMIVEVFYPYHALFGTIGIGDAFFDSEKLYKMAITRPRYGKLYNFTNTEISDYMSH